ncbi:helix-turn-helix domain-containing protein [Gammaproteobacteria bacterium]|jgi:cytoskeletal protein RodZ|nr:helix-turn-helix domain-containing protein [Gammaproteobacteria bacterium]|tara:strand:+ start:675 stop:947 length:273 start_codon:yes stop_codon:yes gene_type:complete
MQISEINNQPSLKSAHTCKIGKLFKERRQLLSLSEIQVASEIFVNVNYIKGIEHGDYSIFPARIFAIQYFKKYADFLNLKLDFFDIYNSQ